MRRSRRLLTILLAGTMVFSDIAAFAAKDGAAPGQSETRTEAAVKEGSAVEASRFLIYKDGEESGAPSGDVPSGSLRETAPDLSGEYLYFDHAEVNGKRVYEVGTLGEITYYGSISGALSILEEGETVGLYYVSRYPVNYESPEGVTVTGEKQVQKGDALTFRVTPSGKGKRLTVTVNGEAVTGTVFDSATGELLFTVKNVQEALSVVIQERDAESYAFTYTESEDALRNGKITSPENGETVKPGGSITIEMESEGYLLKKYALNMLVINGHEVVTLPSDAEEGASVKSVLPGGESVQVTFEKKAWDIGAGKNRSYYTVTISDIYTDLHISEANFKLADREEIIIKELTGIQDIVGWDFGVEKYVSGSVNHVFQQTGEWGNQFYFNLKPGYENPQLTVKVNGIVKDNVTVEKETESINGKQYQYGFDIPDGLGDNVELFLTAKPVSYRVEYRNDKNNGDLIGEAEDGFTVEAGKKDTITITRLTPYETEIGYSPDGYIVEGDSEQTVYYSGDTVRVEDVIAYAKGDIITFVPHWVSSEELGERQITVNLYLEDPLDDSQHLAASYPLSVGKGTALFRPNDERGREYVRDYITDDENDLSWADRYNESDFVLKAGEEEIRVVAENQDSIDFHYWVKRGTLTVNFEWGTGEKQTDTPLPAPVTKSAVIKQTCETDISKFVPEGYMVSKKTVTGMMIEEGVSETVYLYRDADGDGRPDAYTITLTFDAGEHGTINGAGAASEGKLTYKLVKGGAAGITADRYPEIPQVTVTTEGMGWLGWYLKDETGADGTQYGTYAGKEVSADAEDMAFEARYAIAEGYETVTVHYYMEQENGGFQLDKTLQRLEEAGETVTYDRPSVPGYVTPDEGMPGSITVTEGGTNTAEVYYYRDTDKNKKPDTFTLTLSFQGTRHGSWDIKDSMWGQMEEGVDYVYDQQERTLKVFLIKANEAGFKVETYPKAPGVTAEDTWLFDSWQDDDGNCYGSGGEGDGIKAGTQVGADDRDKSYRTVYDRDLNKNKVPDDEESVTVTFQCKEHGKLTGTTEFSNLLPGYSTYPEAPKVTAEEGYVFTGWEPSYERGTVEEKAERNQIYTAVIKADRNGNGTADEDEPKYALTYEGNPQKEGKVENVPKDGGSYLAGETASLSGTVPTHTKADGMSVLFLGWSEQKTEKIYGKGDAAEFKNLSLVTEVVFEKNSQTVYAVWGYDSEDDGKADVLETYHKVTTVLSGEGEGHSISPEAPLVKHGERQEFTITAADGHAVASIAVDGEIYFTNNPANQRTIKSWTLENVTKDCTVTVSFGVDADGNGVPDEYEKPELIAITSPAAVTGVSNGTPLEKISLPDTVTIRTTKGEKQAEVSWNTGGAEYDPLKKEEQTFTVSGTVTLPEGVQNSEGISLTVSVTVTVEGAEPEESSEETTEAPSSEESSEETTEAPSSEESSEETTEAPSNEESSEETTEAPSSEESSEETTEASSSEESSEETTEAPSSQESSEESAKAPGGTASSGSSGDAGQSGGTLSEGGAPNTGDNARLALWTGALALSGAVAAAMAALCEKKRR